MVQALLKDTHGGWMEKLWKCWYKLSHIGEGWIFCRNHFTINYEDIILWDIKLGGENQQKDSLFLQFIWHGSLFMVSYSFDIFWWNLAIQNWSNIETKSDYMKHVERTSTCIEWNVPFCFSRHPWW